MKRLIHPDPLGIDGGVNVYAMANRNPLAFVDPYGLSGFTVQLGLTGGGGGGTGGNVGKGGALSVVWSGIEWGTYRQVSVLLFQASGQVSVLLFQASVSPRQVSVLLFHHFEGRRS